MTSCAICSRPRPRSPRDVPVPAHARLHGDRRARSAAAAARSACSCWPTRSCGRPDRLRRGGRALPRLARAGLCGMAIENRRHLERLTARARAARGGEPPPAGRDRARRRRTPLRRRLPAGAPGARPRRPGRAVADLGPDHGRERHGQGARGADDPRAQRPRREALRRDQLRGAPETLLESELFGIERGVATGVEAPVRAIRDRQRRTLFLDEVGDMPLALRPSSSGSCRSGRSSASAARKRIPIDVRVLAATNAHCRRRSLAASSGKTSTTGCGSSRSLCRPCASGGRTSRSSRATSSSGSPPGKASEVADAIDRRGVRRPARARLCRATSGSSRTCSKGRPRSAGDGVIRLEDLRWLALAQLARGPMPCRGRRGDVPNLRALEERHIRRVLKMAGGNKSRAAPAPRHQPPDSLPQESIGPLGAQCR